MCEQFQTHIDVLLWTLTHTQLIVSKFVDPNGGDVHYAAFIQAVDEEYTGQVVEQENETEPKK